MTAYLVGAAAVLVGAGIGIAWAKFQAVGFVLTLGIVGVWLTQAAETARLDEVDQGYVNGFGWMALIAGVIAFFFASE